MNQSSASNAQADGDLPTYTATTPLKMAGACLALAVATYMASQFYSRTTGPSTKDTPVESADPLLASGISEGERGEPTDKGLTSVAEHTAVGKPMAQADSDQLMQQIENDRRLARRAELQHLGDDARAQLAQLKIDWAQWNASFSLLLGDDRGKRIAADESRIQLFDSLAHRHTLSESQLSSWGDQLDLRLKTIKQLGGSPHHTLDIPEDLFTDVQDLSTAIRKAAEDLSQQQSALNALLANLGEAQVGPDAPTLKDALNSLRGRRALEQEEALVAEVARQTQEQRRLLIAERTKTQQELAAAEIEKERKVREMELAAIRAHTEAAAQKIKDAVAEVEREEAARQAEQKARIERSAAESKFQQALPEIRRYLVPFTTPGNKRIISGKWTYTEEQKPLSLGAVQALGALENTARGHQQFYFLAGEQQNDRPNGVFRDYIGGHIHEPRDVVRAQNLLKEFGELLVEKGMLEP